MEDLQKIKDLAKNRSRFTIKNLFRANLEEFSLLVWFMIPFQIWFTLVYFNLVSWLLAVLVTTMIIFMFIIGILLLAEIT